MSWYYRSWPPPVYQKDTYSCWAAALESWIRVTHRPVEAKTQDEWLGILGDETDDNGGLTKHGIAVMARKVGMGMKVFPHGHAPTLGMMSSNLHNHGHLYFIFSWLNVGHAQVVFGINKGEGTLAFMDPDPSAGGWGTQLLEDYSSESSEFVVGWPQYSPSK